MPKRNAATEETVETAEVAAPPEETKPAELSAGELAIELRRASWHDDTQREKMAAAIVARFVVIPRPVAPEAE